jgi:hypothetical protein
MEVRSVEAIVGALAGREVRYLVVGGLAVIAHGYERLTKDVDLVFALDPDNIRRGLGALHEIGYRMAIPVTINQFADAANREAWRRDKQMVVLKLWSDDHRRTPIDVFVFEPFDFQRELARAEWMDIGAPHQIPILGLDALITMKLEAGRPQDLADVAALEELRMLRERLDE